MFVNSPDVEKLHELLANGTTFAGRHYTWEPRSDWGGDRLSGWGQIADALGWECGSCRPEVGWPKWDSALRSFETGIITINVECGHCGNEYTYDADGVELEVD